MDGEELAAALVERLREVVPAEYAVEVVRRNSGRCVEIGTIADGTYAASGVDAILDQPGDQRELMATACRNVLDAVQDHITISAKDPWPGGVPSLADVAVEDDEILLWYGTQDRILLVLRPIDLS